MDASRRIDRNRRPIFLFWRRDHLTNPLMLRGRLGVEPLFTLAAVGLMKL